MGVCAVRLPATPPPELLEALDVAAGVLERLAARRLDLRIEAGEQLDVQLVDWSGRLLSELSPRQLLDLLAGNPANALIDAGD